ncbi:MAG TPA: sialidase family protein [Solirubrobacteraceae bacterium]|nr:sialidase family protein [Solirubrobacteraceae bacterium]
MRKARVGSLRRETVRGALCTAAVAATALALAGPAGAVIPPSLDEGQLDEVTAHALLAFDRSGTTTPATPFAWAGTVHSGANVTFDPANPIASCGKDLTNYCDITLVDVAPGSFYDTASGGVEFSTRGAPTGGDLDLFVYTSDAAGNVGDLAGLSAGATADERVSVVGATGHYLVVASYFAMTDAGYDGRAEFFRRSKVPPDVDSPRGLQDTLVSDPSKGFRSHSEPHLSQDPTNPDVLVGGSKMYNRDRDSLAEYEFKIGTYASFDRGRSWLDLGQLNTCPAAQAPPSSWPLANRCYPADDPALGGTGPEDATDDRGQGDFGEEYVTSDIWTDFDDEGNAYAMVLDSPPFPGDRGWGMSFHRWETPSRRDVRRGRTWSDRIPIDAHPDPAVQASTLDDKNTFAVNNAGADHDGKTGIIVACWGKNYELDVGGRQAIVCERSVDGGRSWPDEPQAISAPQDPPLPLGPFVIGVHVVADQHDPNTFYAVWLDTLTGFVDQSGLSPVWFSRTTDGAKTWEPARVITRIRQIPNIFPRQSFRNTSLPIMAAAKGGELYLTYADYKPAPQPATDEDGGQADIEIMRSTDAGLTWTAPTTVNQDGTNADQFQPYVRVTPRGQVDVSFFDRRLDRPDPPAHPGNVFIDTFLARSSDAGRSWQETRVSHDMWDPSINPPISTSGQFIGDYQGLVADDCYALPFVNDTHLANDPSRDPGFDAGTPRSRFQEIVTWRVPNTRAFGGDGRGRCDDGGRQPGG